MKDDLERLTKLFAQLGARRPESWAMSQISEGIPQLHRFLFLRQMWELVVGEDDDRWLDNAVAAYRKSPDQPFSGAGRAIERMLALGVARADVVDLVRATQAEMLSGMCYRLEEPGFSDEADALTETIGWALVTTDDGWNPTSQVMGGLHGSVLDCDPTGRDMRPRPEKA